ncbi:SRPBCC domain-containing protein [Streptomyces sp. NPDC007107]|uniref:SRPBCC domain-containing protein n=1 Tax=Streptomyces sp. NPDC007107 TaxID=3156915 RepID=UPI0033CF7E5F
MTRSPLRRRRIAGVLVVLAVLVAGYTVWTNVRPQAELTASSEIRATPEEVWQVLTDLPRYEEWNPFMTSARVISDGGKVEDGARLRIVMHDDSGDSTFEPQVRAAERGRELRWLGRIGPGLIGDGEHRFLIEPLGSGRVRFTQSERFTGVAVPFAAGMLRSRTLPQFHAMNDALAERIAAVRASAGSR